MAANSRFAVATHTVAVLAYSEDKFVTSEFIASSVNTNPVVIRRILSALTKAKLCESQTGKLGGSRLARKPQSITLLDIYRAVECDKLFAQHARSENKNCPVSCNIKGVLSRVFQKCEVAVEDSLKSTTVADLIKVL